jgi:ABC-2 type transport system permease protein
VVSFILSVVVCLFLILAGFQPITDLLVRWASPAFVGLVTSLSVMTHFIGLQKGVVDSRDLLYFASIIGFCLFSTSQVLRSHRAG